MNNCNWNHDLKKGYSFLRNKKYEDYKNINHRYENAYKYLNVAYNKLLKCDPKNNLRLAEISLYKGISLNENLDIKNEIYRNNKAIDEYNKGMNHLKKLKIDENQLLMSLNNSLGVAYHHKDFSHIPDISYKYYNEAYKIYNENMKKKKFKNIMKKVEYNSGYKYKLK
jgi:hypothetical protein